MLVLCIGVSHRANGYVVCMHFHSISWVVCSSYIMRRTCSAPCCFLRLSLCGITVGSMKCHGSCCMWLCSVVWEHQTALLVFVCIVHITALLETCIKSWSPAIRLSACSSVCCPLGVLSAGPVLSWWPGSIVWENRRCSLTCQCSGRSYQQYSQDAWGVLHSQLYVDDQSVQVYWNHPSIYLLFSPWSPAQED